MDANNTRAYSVLAMISKFIIKPYTKIQLDVAKMVRYDDLMKALVQDALIGGDNPQEIIAKLLSKIVMQGRK